MAGLVPAIHVLLYGRRSKTWMPGTSPGMTEDKLVCHSGMRLLARPGMQGWIPVTLRIVFCAKKNGMCAYTEGAATTGTSLRLALLLGGAAFLFEQRDGRLSRRRRHPALR